MGEALRRRASAAPSMSETPLSISAETARRLVVTKQHLGGAPLLRGTRADALSVIRDLAYVQWDPVPIVAPSHLLSLWARLERFDPAGLERMLWTEKSLMLHWTPIASLVLTEDYPLYYSLMRRYPYSLTRSWGAQRARYQRFLSERSDLRRRMLAELRNGPLPLSGFRDHPTTKRRDGDWSPSSDVAQMLYHLHMQGKVMVVAHQGGQNVWGLTDTFLPGSVQRKELPEEELEREAAQRALRALGIATPREIHRYFPRGRYQDLPRALESLRKEGSIVPVNVEGSRRREERYLHADDRPLLQTLGDGSWEPRLSLLPPFDNMLYEIPRTRRLFDFDYVREQFLPPEKRRFGTYVLPILWGDRFLGRIDPRLDRESGVLHIQAVHAEPGAPQDRHTGERIRAAVARLASAVGADRVTYPSQVPGAWKGALR